MNKAEVKKVAFAIVIGIIVIALGQLTYDEIKKFQAKKALETAQASTPPVV
jgi:uncharacterized protein (UPF0333 family)